jgi:signal transduction histidine kinase
MMCAVGGGLLLIGAFAARWISRRITRPLLAATEAAEAIAAGQYDKRLQVQQHDEVGRLTLAFNTMAATVQEARSQQDELVARRTADLSSALEQLREAQDDLVRQEKLALLGQLAGSVGHELRNPLGVMTNAIFYLEMVLDGAPPEVREYLGILRRQVSLSEKITNDLLDFTRHRAPAVGRIDVSRLVTEQLARLGPLRVRVETDAPSDLPPASADAVQIGQIVFNLLTNAVQAMESVADGVLRVGCSAQAGRVRVEVADNGPGVREEVRTKIFEPLFTTRARGIGLGLSVSRRLAEANGGTLTLAVNGHARGATFVLELPVLDGACR